MAAVTSYLHQVLLGVLDALRNSGRDLVSLTETVAHHTIFVTDDDNGGETEVTATLGDFRHTVDGDESVLQFKVRRLDSFNVRICHSLF